MVIMAMAMAVASTRFFRQDQNFSWQDVNKQLWPFGDLGDDIHLGRCKGPVFGDSC